MGIAIRALGIAIVLSASFELLCAQREYHLRLRVIDAAGKPVRKIRVIPVEPPRMPSRPTKSDGTTELLLPHYKVGNSFYVELFDAPRNLTFLPPLPPVPPSRCRTVMPTPPEPAELIVNKRGQRLTSSRALTTITSAILEKSFAKFANSGLTAVPRLSALLEIAELLGLKPKEIDQAIRALPEQTADSYEKGLVALYAQEYPDAIQLLSIFLQMQGKELGNAQESMGREMDATFFLGQ